MRLALAAGHAGSRHGHRLLVAALLAAALALVAAAPGQSGAGSVAPARGAAGRTPSVEGVEVGRPDGLASPDWVDELQGYWVGSIGDLDVQLALEGGHWGLEGHYFYERVGAPLQLQVVTKTRRADGTVDLRLDESDEASGRRTGRFQGRIDPRAGTFAGNWTSRSGKRLPFRLTRFASCVELRECSQVGCVSTAYPHLAASPGDPLAALDALLAGEAKKTQQEMAGDLLGGIERPAEMKGPSPYEEYSTFRIQYQRPGLVSLLRSDYAFTGGAHGNGGASGVTYLLRGGVVETLALQDALRAGPGSRDLLVAAWRRAVGNGGELEWESFKATESELRKGRFESFLVSPRGIAIVISGGGSGAGQVVLSGADLAPLLDPAGPLAFLAAGVTP